MKKAFISFLIMTLMITNISLVNISSVQAATTDNTSATSTDNTSAATTNNTIKVSLDNISDIMNENNLDMKTYSNTLEIAKNQYKIDYNGYDSEVSTYEAEITTYKNTESSEKDAMTAATTAGDTAAYDIAKTAYDTAKTNLATAETNLTSAEDKRGEAKYALRTAKLTYEQEVEALVSTARTAYITYSSAVSKRELQENTLNVQKRDAQVAKVQYESGFLSKNEYNKTLLDNTAEDNTLNELKDAEEVAKSKLCTYLGISSEKNITFSTDINADLINVSKINYNDDLEKMLSNNMDIQQENITSDKLKDTIDNADYDGDTYEDEENDNADYNTNNEEIALKQKMNTVETNFKTQYNLLMNSYNTLKSSNDSLNQGKNDYSIAQIQYDYGFASKNDTDDVKIGTDGLDTANSTYQTNKNTFYVDYLRYLQMKEGY